MTFPDKKFSSIGDFASAYFHEYQKASNSVDADKLASAAKIIEDVHRAGGAFYVCGNGGSAAIANHLACDHGKLLSTDTSFSPHVHSLVSNIEVITAIANDISYDDVFLYQLRLVGQPGDALMTVSSSGDSENVVRAAQWAREHGMKVISMTGFSGGRTADIADINLHVDGDNYGVIEDVHQSLMHLLAQYLRQSEMDEDLIQNRKF